MIKSVYIHIPFCRKICFYCDFCKMYYNSNFVDEYLKSLEKEIKKNYKKENIKTLYIGGGTPSCLNNSQLKYLFKIIDIIKLTKDYEYTFECNIEDINKDFLLLLQKNKINRLSIGVQSFDKKILNNLGRIYNFSIKDKILLAKKYFDNISIDLIYGIKGQTLNNLQEDLNKFIDLDINHISIYSLILEENTILKINNYQEIDEDLNSDMYKLIRNVLNKNHYIHYEISNFAKKGFESKHNLTYWNNEEYYGFGLGASGYIDNIRYSNTRSINKYLKNKYRTEEHLLNKREDMENYLILGLRKIKGISKKEFYKRYDKNIQEVFDLSKLKENKKNFYIEKKHLFISNYILSDFIEEPEK